jgi:DNA-binding transcriptional MerR regulator
MSAGLSIGQVAEQTGLSVHALRFYEREGLLADPVRRESNGRRVYTEDDVEWLDMCIKFRSSGMPLDTIRKYTDLVRQGPGNEHDLNECMRVITHKVTVYQQHLDDGTANSLWVAPSTTPTTNASAAS